MNRIRVSLLFALTCITFQPCEAAQWRSPDGVVAVDSPDMALYLRDPNEDNHLIGWHHPDERLRFWVSEYPGEGALELERHEVEREFLSEMKKSLANVRVVSCENVTRNGCPCVLLSGRGQRDGVEVYYTQLFALVNDKLYVAFALGFDIDTRTHPDAQKFINSFKVLQYDPPPNPARLVGEFMGRIIGTLLCCVLPLVVVGGAIIASTMRRSAYGRRRPRRYDDER